MRVRRAGVAEASWAGAPGRGRAGTGVADRGAECDDSLEAELTGAECRRRFTARPSQQSPLDPEVELMRTSGALSLLLVAVMTMAGCAARGARRQALAECPAESIDAAPCSTRYTKPPELLNHSAIEALMVANYPERLRDRGIGGDVLVWLFIDAQGEVKRVLVKESAGHPDLDRGALTVAAHMKFAPAIKDGEPVGVWVQMPIAFRVTAGR